MKHKPKLKLFVFEKFCPDFSSGLAFAIAPDEKAAKESIQSKVVGEVYDWGVMTVHPLSKSVAFGVVGGG